MLWVTIKIVCPSLLISANNFSNYPYLGAGIFSAFTYFVFSSILHNDIVATLPKSGYAMVFLQIGRVLLGIILIPFLFYWNTVPSLINKILPAWLAAWMLWVTIKIVCPSLWGVCGNYGGVRLRENYFAEYSGVFG